LDNWSKIEFIFAKNLPGITPMILDQMEFWRVEKMLENYEEFVEEENKRNKSQTTEQEKQYSKQSTPNVAMPKIEMPKFEMPRFKL
jgi:sortase (surface protein transpeptidase)